MAVICGYVHYAIFTDKHLFYDYYLFSWADNHRHSRWDKNTFTFTLSHPEHRKPRQTRTQTKHSSPSPIPIPDCDGDGKAVSKYVYKNVCTQWLKANVIIFLSVAKNISSILTFMASNSKPSNLLLMCLCVVRVFLSIHPCHWCPRQKKREKNHKSNKEIHAHRPTMCPNVVLISCWQKQIIKMYS